MIQISFNMLKQEKKTCHAGSEELYDEKSITHMSLFQVLILEPTKVYQPSYLSINKDVDDNTVSIWHVAPDDKVGVHGLTCPATFTEMKWQKTSIHPSK